MSVRPEAETPTAFPSAEGVLISVLTPFLSMCLYVYVQFTVIFIQRIRHCLRCAIKQEIRKIERRFATGGHGADAADAGDDYIFTGELFRPLPDSRLDLLIRDIAIKVVSTADGFGAAEFRLYDLNMHLAQ